MSYSGLAASSGNSVRYGTSNQANTGQFYTDAIALPNSITDGSIYYSAIVRFNGPNISGGVRTAYTSFSTETADPSTDAGFGYGTSSGSSTAMPAGAWIRNSGTTDFHLGSGKNNTDGMGPSSQAPSWQHATLVYPNQQGNIAAVGQDKATIADDIYFIVMKYTFHDDNSNSNAANNNNGQPDDDTVSFWINPIATTLGFDAGEATAGASGGSYYSAINATIGADVDASQIQSFMLLGLTNASVRTDKSIDVSLDELRIGTTWADVTPAAVPEPSTLICCLIGAALSFVSWFRRV